MSRFNSWTNLSQDGRRIERIIKLCETMIEKELILNEKKDHDIILAYIDRLIKAKAVKIKITDLVLGISHTRKLVEKRLEQPKVYLR